MLPHEGGRGGKNRGIKGTGTQTTTWPCRKRLEFACQGNTGAPGNERHKILSPALIPRFLASCARLLLPCGGVDELGGKRTQPLAEELAHRFGGPSGGVRASVVGEKSRRIGSGKTGHCPKHVDGAQGGRQAFQP